MPAAEQRMRVRPPAVADRFYPGSAQRLRADVTTLLAQALRYEGDRPTALVAPHAGYISSGAGAATPFDALREMAESTGRVIVIGPAHYIAFRGVAIPTVQAFETPLGRVALDRDAIAELADLPFVIAADAPHAPEH